MQRPKSVGMVALALAVASSLLPTASGGASPATGTGSATLSPETGHSDTEFRLVPPSGSACSGSGAGSPAYRWHTYMVAASVDTSALQFSTGPDPVGSAFVSPLYDTFGEPIENRFPSSNPLGLISGLTTYSFAPIVGSVPPGAYKLGYACTKDQGPDPGKYWEAVITVTNITATGFDYALGAVPVAPILAYLTSGDGRLSGSFTAAAALPAVTGFTVTATAPQGLTTSITVASSGAFTLTGLVNGTRYTVTVRATNPLGDGPESNIVAGTPVSQPTQTTPPPATVVATTASSDANLTISAAIPIQSLAPAVRFRP